MKGRRLLIDREVVKRRVSIPLEIAVQLTEEAGKSNEKSQKQACIYLYPHPLSFETARSL